MQLDIDFHANNVGLHTREAFVEHPAFTRSPFKNLQHLQKSGNFIYPTTYTISLNFSTPAIFHLIILQNSMYQKVFTFSSLS